MSGCFEDKGEIIGNPDFVASFQFVTTESFIDSFVQQLEQQGIPTQIDVLDDENHWEAVYNINNVYTLYYDEGFIKITFTSEDIDSQLDDVKLFVKSLSLTLDPDQSAEEIEENMNEGFGPEIMGEQVYDEKIPWSDLHLYAPTVMYRFSLTDDGVYEIYAEDERMGH